MRRFYRKCRRILRRLHGCLYLEQIERTQLHNIVRILGAKMPSMSRFYAYMDDLFGYGVVSQDQRKQWWNLDLNVKGLGRSIKG